MPGDCLRCKTARTAAGRGECFDDGRKHRSRKYSWNLTRRRDADRNRRIGDRAIGHPGFVCGRARRESGHTGFGVQNDLHGIARRHRRLPCARYRADRHVYDTVTVADVGAEPSLVITLFGAPSIAFGVEAIRSLPRCEGIGSPSRVIIDHRALASMTFHCC